MAPAVFAGPGAATTAVYNPAAGAPLVYSAPVNAQNKPALNTGFVVPDQRKLKLRSANALIIDQRSGGRLYAKNSEAVSPIASLTKLMTAMVVLDAHLPMDQKVAITRADIDHLKHTRSRLRVGCELTRKNLLYLALLASENRAASALARAYPGGKPAFVASMNLKARALGMLHTHFADASGLNKHSISTADDVAKMVAAAYRYPLIRKITTTPGYMVTLSRRGRDLRYRNTNLLVRNDRWDIGLSKTGYIREAGRCLVMQAKIASRPLIIVLLDSQGRLSRFGDANRIKHWLESAHRRGRPLG